MSTSPRTATDRSGYTLVLAGAVAISFKSIFVRWAYQAGAEPTTLLAMRVWIALPLLLATLVVFEGRGSLRPSASDLAWTAATGACLGTAMMLSFLSIREIGAALATVVTFTYPAWTVGILALAERRPIPGRTGASLLATLGGLALVVLPTAHLPGSGMAAGVALALGAALAFAAQNALTERLVTRMAPIRVLSFAMSWVALAVLPALAPDRLPREPAAWGAAAMLGVVSGYAPMLAFTYGIRRIGAGPAAILASVSPALTVVWAALLLSERLAAIQLAGTALLVLGVRLVRSKPPVDPDEEAALDTAEAATATR